MPPSATPERMVPRPGGPRLEVLADFSQMQAFLAPASPEAGPNAEVFQTVEWLRHLAQHGFEAAPRCWLVGLVFGPQQPRCALALSLADGRVRALSNYYSSVFGPVGESEASAAWTLLAEALHRHSSGAVVDLQPLDAQAPWVASMVAALRVAGYRVDRYFCFGNWYLPVVHASFAEYLRERPSPLRNSIERGRRRLQRAGHGVRIQADAGPGLEEEIAAFESVYRRSWKAPEPCPSFMPGLIRLAAAQGWLRLGVLRVLGEPVAAQLWLVHAGKANIYKLAYVEGFERFSPGSVLTAALMAHVMEVDRVREVDYLTGDDAYKKDWMSHRRERIGLIAFHPRRLRGWLEAARHFGGKGWRRLRSRAVP